MTEDKTNLQTEYGAYLTLVSPDGSVEAYDGATLWIFCPHCFTKMMWDIKNLPPRHCSSCGRGLRTRLVTGVKEEK